MENAKIAFQTIPDGKKPPNGFHYVNCHMVFDIKMEDFQRKACLVTGGHMTYTPDTITYSSVVTRETVHIALTMAMCHDLEVKAADVLNAYVMVPNHEKILAVLGPEFGDNTCNSVIIVTALCRLKSAGALFWAYLAQCMQALGYHPCDSDPDLWMKTEYRPEDKLQYYSYILCYYVSIIIQMM